MRTGPYMSRRRGVIFARARPGDAGRRTRSDGVRSAAIWALAPMVRAPTAPHAHLVTPADELPARKSDRRHDANRVTSPADSILDMGIHYLRTLTDSDALRECPDAGGKLVVVGAMPRRRCARSRTTGKSR